MDFHVGAEDLACGVWAGQERWEQGVGGGWEGRGGGVAMQRTSGKESWELAINTEWRPLQEQFKTYLLASWIHFIFVLVRPSLNTSPPHSAGLLSHSELKLPHSPQLPAPTFTD